MLASRSGPEHLALPLRFDQAARAHNSLDGHRSAPLLR